MDIIRAKNLPLPELDQPEFAEFRKKLEDRIVVNAI
jgi:hypothetical protein